MDVSVESEYNIQVKIREFTLPPVFDGLVIGKEAPIGSAAFIRALELLVLTSFEHIPIEDEVIGDVIVRRNILRRIPEKKFVEFVLRRVKPMMGADEVVHLDINVEVLLREPS